MTTDTRQRIEEDATDYAKGRRSQHLHGFSTSLHIKKGAYMDGYVNGYNQAIEDVIKILDDWANAKYTFIEAYYKVNSLKLKSSTPTPDGKENR